MTKEDTFRAFRAVADSADMDFEKEFSPEAFRELMVRLESGLQRAFTGTEEVDIVRVKREQEVFQRQLEARLAQLRNNGLKWDEKGVRDWIASLCPGFWPFC